MVRKDDRHQGPVELQRSQGYSPLRPSERWSLPQPCKEGFRGRLAAAYGNRKGERDPKQADDFGYQTTVPQGIEAKEVLNLIGGEGELALVLCEHHHYF